jgi:Sortase and related acyltransferases
MTEFNNDITFKNAELNDLPYIVDIYNQTIPGRMITADTSPVTVADRIAWFEEHNTTNRPLWLIQYKNKPCGWVSLSTFYGRPAFNKTVEVSLYIEEQYRGKKIGQYTMQTLEKYAQEIGICNIFCFIFGHNQPSLALFNKLGYQKWGLLPGIAELDEIKRDLVILGKQLK